jgi:uncharacterized protein YdiU (UPF0061 family)
MDLFNNIYIRNRLELKKTLYDYVIDIFYNLNMDRIKIKADNTVLINSVKKIIAKLICE